MPSMHQWLGLWRLHLHRNDEAARYFLTGQDLSSVTIERVTEAIQNFTKNNNTHIPDNHIAVAAAKSGSKKKRGSRSRPLICHRCHAPGHIASVCDGKRVIPVSTLSTVLQDNRFSGVMTSQEFLTSEKYWLDSMAPRHVSNNRAHFNTFTPMDGTLGGVGGSFKIKGPSRVRLTSHDGNIYTHMDDLLFAPNCPKNHVSVSVCQSKGYNIYFGEKDVTFNGNVCAVRYGVYLFLFKPEIVATALQLSSQF